MYNGVKFVVLFRVCRPSTFFIFDNSLICSCKCTKFFCCVMKKEKRAAHVPTKLWSRQIEFWLNGFLGVLTKIAEKWAKTCDPIEHMQIETFNLKRRPPTSVVGSQLELKLIRLTFLTGKCIKSWPADNGYKISGKG